MKKYTTYNKENLNITGNLLVTGTFNLDLSDSISESESYIEGNYDSNYYKLTTNGNDITPVYKPDLTLSPLTLSCYNDSNLTKIFEDVPNDTEIIIISDYDRHIYTTSTEEDLNISFDTPGDYILELSNQNYTLSSFKTINITVYEH